MQGIKRGYKYKCLFIGSHFFTFNYSSHDTNLVLNKKSIILVNIENYQRIIKKKLFAQCFSI